MTSIGPQLRECAICHKQGMAPEIVPYFDEGGMAWKHPGCQQKVYAAMRIERHEHGDGV